jgi:hypothetical protein
LPTSWVWSQAPTAAKAVDAIMDLHLQDADDLVMFAGDLANYAAMILRHTRRTTLPMDDQLEWMRQRILEMPALEDQFPPGEYQRLVDVGELPDEGEDLDKLLDEEEGDG